MTWARFDDGFPQHPKIVGLSDQAFRLHVSAVCYSNANLTDGVIHGNVLPLLLPGRPAAAIRRRAAELLEAGVWEHSTDGCYGIHDFLIYNKPRSEVMATRQANATNGAKGAASRWHHGLNGPDPIPSPSRPSPDPIDGDGAAARDAREDARAKAIEMHEWAFRRTPSHKASWEIVAAITEFGEPTVRKAFKEAGECGGKSWPYVQRVLATFKTEGVR